MENKKERGYSFLFFWADSHRQICPFAPYRFSNPRKAYQSKHGGGCVSDRYSRVIWFRSSDHYDHIFTFACGKPYYSIVPNLCVSHEQYPSFFRKSCTIPHCPCPCPTGFTSAQLSPARIPATSMHLCNNPHTVFCRAIRAITYR